MNSIISLILPLLAWLVVLIAWLRRLFACRECGGAGGYQTSEGWVPCWRCIRSGKVRSQ